MSSPDLAHRDNPNYTASQTELAESKRICSTSTQFPLTSLDQDSKDTPKVKKKKVSMKL